MRLIILASATFAILTGALTFLATDQSTSAPTPVRYSPRIGRVVRHSTPSPAPTPSTSTSSSTLPPPPPSTSTTAAPSYVAPPPTASAVVTAPPATTPPAPASPTPSSTGSTYDTRWDRVASCEEGGWGNYGFPAYPDSLGISATNWYANGGGSDLSPAAQVAVAQRIEGTSFVPDQNGCAAW